MRPRSRRKWWAILAACSAATVFQVGTGGCAQYGAEFLFEAFNVCSVVNCEGSAFFNFCSPFVLFWDCL